jgi:ATP-GRASP peptide maturase of grasp-with-spasm system
MKGKYILILAEDEDITAHKVIKWLYNLGSYNVVRIKNFSKIEILSAYIGLDKLRFKIKVDNIIIDSDEILSYWYRRGQIYFDNYIDKSNVHSEQMFINGINTYYNQEKEHVLDYLHYLLKTIFKISINNFQDIFTNKLINQQVALDVGLNVPATIISNSIDDVYSFLSIHKKCITKTIRSSGGRIHENSELPLIHFSQATNLFELDDLDVYRKDSNLVIIPTLFQKYIEKKIEIRTFFLLGKFYSMAIFSQQNEKTKIDFRNYDMQMPNRIVPFKLPLNIEKKLNLLMNKLDMNSGSMDIMIDNEGNYFFLEVNPVGQIDWLSDACNYPIEFDIAKSLITAQLI